MRRVTILPPVVAMILSIIVFFSLTIGVRAFVTMSFGGQPDQNFWNVDITYCTDGIQLVATQTAFSSDEPGVDYWLELTTASPPVSATLPATIAQGNGSKLVTNTAVFPFASTQSAGTAVQITVERWDHGVDHYVAATGMDAPNRDTDSSTIDNCSILPKATVTSTAAATIIPTSTLVPTDTPTITPIPTTTATSTTIPTSTLVPTNTPLASATSTSTTIPTSTLVPTNTPLASATSANTFIPTNTPLLTATSTPTPQPQVPAISTPASTSSSTSTPPPPLATATATARPTMIVAIGVPLANPKSPHLLAVQSTSDLSKAGGHGQFGQALKLFVPANAAGTALTLHVQTLPPGNLPASQQALPSRGSKQPRSVGMGYIYALTATDAHGRPVSQFSSAHPLLLQLGYDPTGLAGIDPASLHIAFADPAGKTWQSLPTTVDTFHHLLTALTTHFTLFQVQGVTKTSAQLSGAQAHLTLLAAAGAPRVTMLPTSQATVGGVPLDLILPAGRQHAPVSLTATGLPGAQLKVTFTLAGTAIMQTLSLDARGYAATAFTPPHPLKSAQRLQVSVSVSLGTSHYSTTSSVTMQPGQSSGPLPSGAPPLWASLASSRVRAGVNHPLVLVQTAPGLVVQAMLVKAGKPLAGLKATTGTANRQGIVQCRLPLIPRALLVGKTKTVTLQVVATVARRGQSSQQTLPLTVGL